MGENRGPVLLGNLLAFGVATFCIVVWRIGFRVYRRRIDFSDWCIAIALVSSLCQEAFNAACVTKWGYGQHVADLPPWIAHSAEPLKLYWLNQIFFKVTTLLTKLSLFIVYLGLFQRANSLLIRWTRVVNYGTAFLVVSYYGAAFFASIFQCRPISKAWQPKEAGTCINLTDFRYVTGAINIITSVLVITTPLPALFRMKHRGTEVTQLIGLILLGVVHTGCTIARLVLMVYPDPVTKTDPQWANTPANTLAVIEMDVGIIAASLVVMRPCFQAIYDTILSRNGSRTINSKRSSFTASSTHARWQRDNKITRTIDIELNSHSVSMEDMLSRHDWYHRGD